MVAPDWTAGYIADIDYTHGFYRELTPSHLRFALLLKGIRPPDGKFTYCELGFGQGFGLNLLAAAHPEGDFWGTDFNPTHAANARLLAESVGADNVHVFDRSFAEFLETDTPDFDFICLHGVWAWVAPDNQRLIVEFLRRRLKPRGVVFISYNTPPGWAPILPLRELLKGHAALSNGPLLGRIGQAIDFVGRLQALEAGFFAVNPAAAAHCRSLRDSDLNYVAHEFFNGISRPAHFSDVADALKAAGLRFAVSSYLSDQVECVNLNPEAEQLLAGISEPLERESVRDFLVNRSFRRDLFVRDAARLDPAERMDRLLATRVFLLTPPDAVALRRRFPVGECELRAEIYRPLLEELGSGPRTLAELASCSRLQGVGVDQLVEAVTFLTGIGRAVVAVDVDPSPDAAERRRRAIRFNDVVLDRSRLDETMGWLASPLAAGGVPTRELDRLFLLALRRGEGDPPGFANRVLWQKNRRLVRDDGTMLEGEAEMLQEARRQ